MSTSSLINGVIVVIVVDRCIHVIFNELTSKSMSILLMSPDSLTNGIIIVLVIDMCINI
jgi:hypothetical protein